MSDSEMIENPTTLKRRSSLEVVSGSQGQETPDLAEQLQERPRIGLVLAVHLVCRVSRIMGVRVARDTTWTNFLLYWHLYDPRLLGLWNPLFT